MSRREVKLITVVLPGRGTTIPFTVTPSTTFPELLCAAGCPDGYAASLTRKGPAVSVLGRRVLDVVSHKGKLYLSPPTNSQQLDLRLQGDQSMDGGFTVRT